MKKLMTILVCLLSTGSFAAGTLDCISGDGSALKAIVNNEEGSIPTQVEYSVRGDSFKSGKVLQYVTEKSFFNGQSQGEQIVTIAIRDAQNGELALVITNGTLLDKTGSYSVDCQFGY